MQTVRDDEKARTIRELQELAKIAFFDPRRLFNPDGSAKDVAALDDDCAACIEEYEVTESADYTVTKFKLADKLRALELLGKHLGMWTDVVKLVGKRVGEV